MAKKRNMMKKRYILLLSFCWIALGMVNGQNLVPNFSFEEYTQCPEPGCSIECAKNWINCGNTPDYYNACANSSFPAGGVPENLGGYQTSYEGNGYGGFGIYSNPDTGREYIGVQLLQPLIIGTKYYISSYISKGGVNETSGCSTNKFGFHFFNNMYFNSSSLPVKDNFCHVFSDLIISDTTNWTKISGSFIADSAYSYLVIGNFFDNPSTDTLNCEPISLAYYFIDNVCVSPDSTICNGNVGIKKTLLHRNIIYTNPADNVIYFKNLPLNSRLTLTNTLGEILIDQFVGQESYNMDVSSISNGIYFININNQYFTKILINHY